MKKATKADIEIIKQAFIEKYSDAVTELNYKNDYELLIAIILSAQCTDKNVNNFSSSCSRWIFTFK